MLRRHWRAAFECALYGDAAGVNDTTVRGFRSLLTFLAPPRFLRLGSARGDVRLPVFSEGMGTTIAIVEMVKYAPLEEALQRQRHNHNFTQ